MTLVHETAHALMHNKESTYVKEYKGLNVKELEAELTSFVVNKHFGIDTSEQTIPYIASWTDNLKNIKDIESSLKDIQHTSSRIINGIEENISKEFLKEMQNELNTNNINDKTNNVTVIDNISLDGNYPMDFEEFKELQSYLPIKSNTKTGIALKTTEISKPSYLVKRLDELSKTKTVGLDIDGNFKQPIIHIKETNQVMPLKVLSKNIKSNNFDIEAFTYELYTNPHHKLFDGDFNVFNNKTVMEQVKIDADLNGVPDIYQKSIDKMKESSISRESTHEKKMELN